MKDTMKEFETLMGSKHVLVDDWNTLGWEFYTIPLSHIRAVTLTNYTEAKAEGGSISFTIEDRYKDGTYVPVVKVMASEGSGPHGIPWWDFALCQFEGEMELTDVAKFAEELKRLCNEESQSYYWSPWRDENPQRHLLFKDRAIGETVDRDVEIPFNWSEDDWNRAVNNYK